jgi:hypothetical protein
MFLPSLPLFTHLAYLPARDSVVVVVIVVVDLYLLALVFHASFLSTSTLSSPSHPPLISLSLHLLNLFLTNVGICTPTPIQSSLFSG